MHWALAVYRNEEFLETGNVAKGRFRLSRNRFVSQKLGSEDKGQRFAVGSENRLLLIGLIT